MENNFNSIKDRKLRAYNRIMMMININNTHGEERAEGYVEQFERDDQVDMASMSFWIRRDGLETVKAAVNREVK